MDEGMVKIILAVISLLGAIVTGVLVPYIRAKTTTEQRENVYDAVKKGVQAAEQVLKVFDPDGDKRKTFVIDYLNKKKIKITEEDLEVFLESAVLELNIAEKKLLTQEDRE